VLCPVVQKVVNEKPSLLNGLIETTPLPISLLSAAGIDQCITQHWQGSRKQYCRDIHHDDFTA
jgi:hypothetical protein